MTEPDIPIFDADNHLYETEEAFTRHLPSKHEGLIRYVDVDGRKKIAVGGTISDYIPNPTFEVVARPGAFADYFGGHNPEGKSLRELTGKPMRSVEAFRTAEARLPMLDDLGLAGALMFPTLASLLEVRFTDDPELTCTVIHAFNEWLHDEWSFNYKDRIFATPIVNPCIPERGIAELDWLVERGARAVLLRPAPVAGFRGTRSPFLPEFDAFWARVAETEVLVTLHASDSGYQRYVNDWEGTERRNASLQAETVLRRRHARPGHQRRHYLRHLRRNAQPLSDGEAGQRRERWELGGVLPPGHGENPFQDASSLHRASSRRISSQHLDQSLLGGLDREPCGHDVARACSLRIRLPPPRGHGRSARSSHGDGHPLLPG